MRKRFSVYAIMASGSVESPLKLIFSRDQEINNFFWLHNNKSFPCIKNGIVSQLLKGDFNKKCFSWSNRIILVHKFFYNTRESEIKTLKIELITNLKKVTHTLYTYMYAIYTM